MRHEQLCGLLEKGFALLYRVLTCYPVGQRRLTRSQHIYLSATSSTAVTFVKDAFAKTKEARETNHNATCVRG